MSPERTRFSVISAIYILTRIIFNKYNLRLILIE